MSPADTEVDGHIGLSPVLLKPQGANALSQPHQKGMIDAGHTPIVGVLSGRCVRYA